MQAPSIESQLDEMQRMRERERAGPSEQEVQAAEARFLWMRALLLHNPALRMLAPHGIVPWAEALRHRNEFVDPLSRDSGTHECTPELCTQDNIRSGVEFVDPFDLRVYRATGLVYLCCDSGAAHYCSAQRSCGKEVYSEHAPGVRTCWISKRDRGPVIADATPYGTRGTRDQVQDDNLVLDQPTALRLAARLANGRVRARPRAAAASAPRASGGRHRMALAPGGQAAPATPQQQQQRRPRDTDADGDGDGSDGRRRRRAAALEQACWARNPMQNTRGPAQRDEVHSVVDRVLVRQVIVRRLEELCAEMDAAAEADLASLLRPPGRQGAGRLSQKALGGAGAAAAASAAEVTLEADRAPPTFMACMSLMVRHMNQGMLSMLEVCRADMRPSFHAAELEYYERSLITMVTNIRRATVFQPRRGENIQKEPNLKNIVLVLLHIMRDGLVAYRAVRRHGDGEVLLPVVWPLVADVGLDVQRDNAYACIDAASDDDDSESESASSSSSDGGGDADGSTAPRPRASSAASAARARWDAQYDVQRFVLVESNPRLRWVLPEQEVLSRLVVAELPGETEGLMKKMTQALKCFAWMLYSKEPNKFRIEPPPRPFTSIESQAAFIGQRQQRK